MFATITTVRLDGSSMGAAFDWTTEDAERGAEALEAVQRLNDEFRAEPNQDSSAAAWRLPEREDDPQLVRQLSPAIVATWIATQLPSRR